VTDLGKPPERSTVGGRLLELRRAEGLSQEEMARALGVSTKGYRNYEVGERHLPGALYFKIARMFSVDPAWLYDGVGLGPSLRHKGGEAALWRETLVLVEEYLDQNDLALSAHSKVKVIDAIVSHLLEGGSASQAYVAKLVGLVA
jgi:transcriptional regulator with XRE-family HTH domain